MAFEPPAGYVDCENDGDAAPPNDGPFREIDVPGVGIIHARRPLPNAIPALSSAANSKVSDRARLDYLDLFILNHLKPGEFEEILARMTDPDLDMPPDSMLRVSRAIATAGTARPTRRSSTSH
ncbi:hypothetical protein I5G59_gp35 [Mycobacterium phage LilMcDreamy]|uniref:Tail assembly chaperone n=1 Tax=Mycobacterium phage LilMcDreamy TaxID=2652422 RepID=A0A5P8D6J0_9CAUD|nr:hypothetical protein I5G59_gp35 [Mycobacterium phage LilMcDreamy]QFP94655.1 hypothetical protein SEA_LILMCDREAMY_35 [Mycobacterium phage LilMcDreamy]